MKTSLGLDRRDQEFPWETNSTGPAVRRKVETGVSGLDQLLGGGFPEGSIILVTGSPGSGKTVLCTQFVLSGCARGEPGIIVASEEKSSNLEENLRSFGLDLGEWRRRGLLQVLDISPFAESKTLPRGDNIMGLNLAIKTLPMILLESINRMRARRLVLDSLTAFLAQLDSEGERRMQILGLAQKLKETRCTSLVTSEPIFSNGRGFGPESFLLDGIVNLELLPAGAQGEMVRVIHVSKMRGAKHDFERRPYILGEQGVEVYPEDRVYPMR